MSENRRSLKQMMAAAQAEIERISAENLLPLSEQEDVVIVVIRDIRELWRDGKIPNSIHAPRGMLEWWVDPDSPYHREAFAPKDKKYVMCSAGGGRAFLAAKAMQEVGIDDVCDLIGGFNAWKEIGGSVEERPVKTPE